MKKYFVMLILLILTAFVVVGLMIYRAYSVELEFQSLEILEKKEIYV